MKTFGQVILAAAVVLALFAGGCGDEKCASESPQVDAVGNCSAVANTAVSFPIRLCPTCNQTLSDCTVDLSDATSAGGTIFLNPTVEACDSASSCGPGCNLNPSTCSFTAPNAAATTTYTVLVFDPGSNGTKSGTLTIVPGSPSCQLL
jgi:hypothetical protein